MRGSSNSHNNKKKESAGLSESGEAASIDWEMRPGGMLVQKREDDDSGAESAAGPIINIRVCHDTAQHELSVPAQINFGELKRILAQKTGLEPQEQRLLFRGKEKNNEECLHMAGIKDTSKLVLLEDPASKERKLEQMKKNEGISKACEAVVLVRSEVDILAEKVTDLESAVRGGTKVEEKEFLVLTESLMVQLLKLDGVEAEGEARVQRKMEVRRIQSLVDTVDALKARNANPFSDSSSTVSVTTQWETFDSGVGSLSAPPMASSTNGTNKGTDDWERFD